MNIQCTAFCPQPSFSSRDIGKIDPAFQRSISILEDDLKGANVQFNTLKEVHNLGIGIYTYEVELKSKVGQLLQVRIPIARNPEGYLVNSIRLIGTNKFLEVSQIGERAALAAGTRAKQLIESSDLQGQGKIFSSENTDKANIEAMIAKLLPLTEQFRPAIEAYASQNQIPSECNYTL